MAGRRLEGRGMRRSGKLSGDGDEVSGGDDDGGGEDEEDELGL